MNTIETWWPLVSEDSRRWLLANLRTDFIAADVWTDVVKHAGLVYSTAWEGQPHVGMTLPEGAWDWIEAHSGVTP